MNEPLYQMGFESPVGFWLLVSTETYAISLEYMGEQRLPETFRIHPETRLEKRLHCMLTRYFNGEPVDFSRVPVLFSTVSRFTLKVLTVLRQVPYGEVRHYQWLASAVGNASAARAVGGALGRNPLPILVPCHRIITKDGVLGGFMRGATAGVRIKTFLLGLEGVCLSGTGVGLNFPEIEKEEVEGWDRNASKPLPSLG
jgi:methylated-DNA-[protein]-cysteine S-methyltransferase